MKQLPLDKKSLLGAVIRLENLQPFVGLVFAFAAIPVLDGFGIAAPDGGPLNTCVLHRAGAAVNVARDFSTLISVFGVGWINFLLYRYLIVISGRHDKTSPNDRPAAIIVSGMLFLCLITLYATLYFIHLPCLHYVYSDRSGWHRWLADLATNFYFSSVTITTLGYGDLNPRHYIAGELIAAFESLNGLVMFGIFTGAIATFLARGE